MTGGVIVASIDGAAPAAAIEPASTPAQSAVASAGQVGHGVGEVRRVDRANRKIAVRHGPIAGLKDANGKDMPGMTMLFSVKDPSWLDAMKVGDAIDFTVVRDEGQLRIDSYAPVR